jgi:hypothetical protein
VRVNIFCSVIVSWATSFHIFYDNSSLLINIHCAVLSRSSLLYYLARSLAQSRSAAIKEGRATLARMRSQLSTAMLSTTFDLKVGFSISRQLTITYWRRCFAQWRSHLRRCHDTSLCLSVSLPCICLLLLFIYLSSACLCVCMSVSQGRAGAPAGLEPL